MGWIKEQTTDWFPRSFHDRASSDEKSSLIIADPERLDLHLSYSKGLEKGPIIQRNGDSPPIMEDPERPGSYTTDPERQRIGTYYILDERQQSDTERLFFVFVGSYILYSCLPDINSPQEKVENFFRNNFPKLDITGLDGFLHHQYLEAINAGKFSLTTVESIGIFKPFLQQNAAHFKRDLPFFNNYPADFKNLSEYAANALHDAYKKYPEFITNFHEHRNEKSFRYLTEMNVEKFLKLFIMSRNARSHEQCAREKTETNKLGDIVLMQGCGDLTMNLWNVAFVSGLSYQGDKYDKRDWDLLHPPDEPLNDRKYSCLIKWVCDKDDKDLQEIAKKHRIVYPYQIAKLQFKAPSLEDGVTNRHVFLGEEPIGHLIEFAVYGQHVLRDQVFELDRIKSVIREFSDIRHIYKLPNINPDIKPDEVIEYRQAAQSVGITDYVEKPRFHFSESTYDDLWLCEKSLIQGDRNLRVAALNQAIQFDKKELGAPRDWIEIVLQREAAKNTYHQNNSEELSRGQWRWVPEGNKIWLEIFLIRNQYPCTMIGITAKDEKRGAERKEEGLVDTENVYFLAHGHNYEQNGCTIEEAARFLEDRGAWNALLFDEGNDVFQLVRDSESRKLVETVPIKKRDQLRCVFWATER
jgi:hypothetical protein